MSLSQRARSLAVTTPLGEDVLLLRAMKGRERLSTLFKYHLDLISESYRPIRHEELLGQPVTVRLDLPDDRTRYFNGIVSRFSYIGSERRLTHYRATLVPWLWLLTRTTDCRIFQEQTVPDIVKAICRERGYSDFEEFLVEPHHSRSYCVQYRETDFDFISRLLEQEGIYYFFRHEKDRHTLVLTDDYGAHRPVAGYEEIPYYPPSETALRERDHIDDWSVTGAVQSGAFTHTDFNFKAPRSNLRTGRDHPHEQARWDLEVYDYPGGYTRDDQGDDWARARIEELHAGYETARGKGNARGLTTGAHFKLSNYPYFNPDPARCLREDPNREYLVVSAKYRLQSDAFGTASAVGATGATDTGPVFRCKFTALDAQTPFRPPRVTKKPHIKGPQTAIVVGYGDQEIWTDQYGRVKVQFHWDRYGQSDEKSSCWIRVAHPWAGKGWGAIAIPRVGQEVIVEFLEGDPDRPIITGQVYNAVNQPPYQLPDNATLTGLKSQSSKDGWGKYNEYVMDDAKGRELIREHGQHDKESTIEHDLREQVRHDRKRDVTHNETIQVGNDHAKAIGGNETSAIGGDREEKVGGTVALTAQNLIIEAGGSITLKVGGGYLVVDQSGVTLSNSPPNAPLVNRGGLPLTWLGKLLEGPDLARLGADAPGPVDCCSDVPKPIAPTACDKPMTTDDAGCDYYKKRHKDFLDRHKCCEPPVEEEPPKYYEKFGFKYCDEFTTETYQRLSPQGQAWLQAVRCRLQQDIEKKLRKDPGVELKAEEFEDFVFDSHNKAYRKAGLLDLPCADIGQIQATYGLDAWKKILGRWDSIAIGLDTVGECIKQADEEQRDAKRMMRGAFPKLIDDLLE